MWRLKWPVILLGLLAAGLAVDLAPRAVAAGPEAVLSAGQPGSACPDLGVELLMGRNGLYAEAAPNDLASAETPLRFDCGIGEAWRHHVP